MDTARWVLMMVLVAAAGSADLTMAQEDSAPAPAPAQSPVPVRKAANAPTTRATRAVNTRRQNARTAGAIPASVTTALQEMAKEFGLGKLRDRSDFFTNEPNAELTAQLVVQLLGRRLGESDAMDGYIKWQLLSAINGDIPEEMAGAAINAYQNGPGLQRRPGMDMADRRALDVALRKATEAADVAAELDMEVRRTDELNKSVREYRDTLFTRLPVGIPAFEAALNDVYERCKVGAVPQSLVERVAGRAEQWISRDASEAEVKQLVSMVRKLMMAQIPDYYDGVIRNDQGPGYVWRISKADPGGGGRLDDVLQSAARRLGSIGGSGGAGAGDVGNTGRTRNSGRRGR